ncbi:hypothetical protein PHMEG_00029085 [Phytophthora megakarya]|uniref:Uncharacterized protein n=1 Tax=Phytophthora megakarya TaxID=4795 RepID=A0A225V3E6_9STRA|nr:hypothetical protein PHMEG_00029085 [Phytophthora megakarya]
MPGKTALILRLGCGRGSERVLLGQFYNCHDQTTLNLVQQGPKPQTLEYAVKKATDIDDQMDNVVMGMIDIGQRWTTAPNECDSGHQWNKDATAVVIGVENGMEHDGEVQAVALFTNPQGVYNTYLCTWDPSPGRIWNRKHWAPKPSKLRERLNSETSDGKA